MEGTSWENRRKRCGLAVYITVVVLALAAVFIARPLLPEPLQEYEPGQWIQICPEGTSSATGEPVATYIRVGRENKTVILFCGGGISYNEYMAARSYGATEIPDGFYSDNGSVVLENLMGAGMFSESAENTFRDWNMIVIPYSTADFHVGTGDFEYTTLEGETAVLHHYGYTNYRAIMKEARRYIPETEEVLICGYSAGGYAAAMLAEDIIENQYPGAENYTLCVDSALLLIDDWQRIMEDVWQTPAEILQYVESDNLVVDFYGALYEKYGDRLTYLYVGSLTDGELSRYQSYADTGEFSVSNDYGEEFAEKMETMAGQLREVVPGIGIYVFDKLPYTFYPEQIELTQHTILPMDMIFWPLMENVSVMEWLDNAVNGNVESILPKSFG